MARLTLLVAALCLFACDQPASSNDPNGGHGNFGDGRLFLDWTVGGQSPSVSACTGVDHLKLTLDDGFQTVTIDPIPCTLTRFRYDGLFEGSSTVTLDGIDTVGCRVASGSAAVELTAVLPAAPSPTVAIAALAGGGCAR